MTLTSIEAGNERKSWASSFPSDQIGGRDTKIANVVNTTSASTLEKSKALLEEIVTELNSSASNSSTSNSEGIVPRPARTGSDAIQNEHRRLFGFQYRGGSRGRYNPFSRGRDRADTFLQE